MYRFGRFCPWSVRKRMYQFANVAIFQALFLNIYEDLARRASPELLPADGDCVARRRRRRR